MAGFDVVVHFTGRNRRQVTEDPVRRLGNGNSCNLNDTESVYDLDYLGSRRIKQSRFDAACCLVVASAYSKMPELR